ncbi:asparagine synthase (glutamine-hydrolysing)/amidotransferase [Amycolatopsis arida]|uniref:asparagine synthase (glutamine-hydrolyzing) n=1 Tax=Amycolatopsis arida TaxID=587909 RepID=A0A1I6A8J8_9PSEU|nr:asparagine synthase-related protein [Amycolatopsis arida]TDX88514.1 asparagine synthase (glutamine-hydrolysing)/amidotransferase [Amycolatopsis arida]SFQ65054.1 asparagine synthase (glutamine-hydrolysing)/amidotransferase [Amycolatopsis arida]
MSGVVGWIDFTRDLVRDRGTLLDLTATLARRGPDAEALWIGGPAALGVRAVRTGRAESAQPFALTPDGPGTPPVVAVVVGWPLGLAALRGRLRSAGVAVAPDAGAAELAARAYVRWGAEFVPELAGSFAVVVWDGRHQELLLARDQTGAGQNLFYAHTASGMVFASERKTLLAHPEISAVLDVSGLREAISHALPAGPLFAGFSQIEPAEIARYGRSGWARHRYWQLETRPHTDDLDTTVATVRGILEDSVREHLPEDTSSLIVTLSGGIDSSAVAALTAAEMARQGRGALRTFTVDFVDTEFQADVMRGSKDEPYARAVAERIGADYGLVTLEPTDILDPVVRVGMLRSKDYPTRIYDMDSSQYLFLAEAAAQGGKLVLGGGAGDQVFLGNKFCTDQGLVRSGTFPWIALAQRFGATNGFGTGLLSQDLLRELDFPTYYRDTYATVVAGVEHLPEDDEERRRARISSHLMLNYFRVDGGAFTAAGLVAGSPINHHRLLQYAYNIPPELHTHGGVEKGLLRSAVADLLPEQVLARRQSATPVSHHPQYPQRLGVELKAVLANSRSPVLPLIDVSAAAELAAQPDRLVSDRLARADAEMVLQLDLWFDRYGITPAW